MTPSLFAQMALSNWQTQNKRVDELIAELSDSRWMDPTAPGRNSGHYLLGHLAAVNDALLPLLGLGERLHPELKEPFLDDPEQSGSKSISLASLKASWKEINEKLNQEMAKLRAEDWFKRHNSVSEADFAKEPHRNKLNVLINRSIHQGYHLGQLAYLRDRKEE